MIPGMFGGNLKNALMGQASDLMDGGVLPMGVTGGGSASDMLRRTYDQGPLPGTVAHLESGPTDSPGENAALNGGQLALKLALLAAGV